MGSLFRHVLVTRRDELLEVLTSDVGTLVVMLMSGGHELLKVLAGRVRASMMMLMVGWNFLLKVLTRDVRAFHYIPRLKADD